MKAIIKRPGEHPELMEVEDDPVALRAVIGGALEHLGFDTFCGTMQPGINKIGMLVDMEGKLKGKEANFFLCDDVIAGTVLFVGEKGEDFVSLSREQQLFIMDLFQRGI